MGPTGTGKSNVGQNIFSLEQWIHTWIYPQFIDVVTKAPSDKLRAGSSLGLCTQKIQATRVRNHDFYSSEVVLVDTPGFDDDKRSDIEILELIGDWLKKT